MEANQSYMDAYIKIKYDSGVKKINAYLKMPSTTYYVLRKEIEFCLFEKHKEPVCEYRTYWTDEDNDEIEIINQNDYDIFMTRRAGRYPLQVAPINLAAGDSTASSNKTKIPPAAGSYDGAVHDHVECDACLMAPIIGFRYKCIQCANYDLCENCEAKHIHPEHMMVRMPTSNCPNVVESYITGRNSGRRHFKRSKASCPFVKSGISVVIDDDTEAQNTTTSGGKSNEHPSPENGKERQHGRRHHNRHNRNFFSHLYEMMNDLAEGGGASAAAHAMGEGSTTKTSTSTSTNGTQTATATITTNLNCNDSPNMENPIAAAIAAKIAAQHAHDAAKTAADIAAQHAHDTAKTAAGIAAQHAHGSATKAAGIGAQHAHGSATKVAEIAAKVAHESAMKAAKNIVENLTFPKYATAAAPAAENCEKEKEAEKHENGEKEKVDATTSPQGSESQTGSVLQSPSMESIAQFLDPHFVKTGVQILNNFSDMFAKILDPVENVENRNSQLYPNLSINSINSRNSVESDKNSNEEKTINEKQDKEDKPAESDTSVSQVEIDDLGTDSENESVSESFIKLYAPKKANVSTPQSSVEVLSTRSTSPRSLDNNNAGGVEFSQLATNLKSHIDQENKKDSLKNAETNTEMVDNNSEIHSAQETKENSVKSVKHNAEKASETKATETASDPTITTNTTSASTATLNLNNSNKTEEKRGVLVYHPDQRINNAVHAMMSMGFSNEGAWLTRLLESVNGDIPQALDIMSAAQRGGSR